jgi:hypothetical protein
LRLGQLRFSLCNLRFRLFELTLELRHLSVGLIESRLEWPRIDLKQELTLLHERAFFVILSQQVAGYLCL